MPWTRLNEIAILVSAQLEINSFLWFSEKNTEMNLTRNRILEAELDPQCIILRCCWWVWGCENTQFTGWIYSVWTGQDRQDFSSQGASNTRDRSYRSVHTFSGLFDEWHSQVVLTSTLKTNIQKSDQICPMYVSQLTNMTWSRFTCDYLKIWI